MLLAGLLLRYFMLKLSRFQDGLLEARKNPLHHLCRQCNGLVCKQECLQKELSHGNLLFANDVDAFLQALQSIGSLDVAFDKLAINGVDIDKRVIATGNLLDAMWPVAGCFVYMSQVVPCA